MSKFTFKWENDNRKSDWGMLSRTAETQEEAYRQVVYKLLETRSREQVKNLTITLQLVDDKRVQKETTQVTMQQVYIHIENGEHEPETLVRWYDLIDEDNLRINAEHLVKEERPDARYIMSQIVKREIIEV